MAICNALTTGLSKSCDTNSGGVNKIWVGDFEHLERASITITSNEVSSFLKLVSSSVDLQDNGSGYLQDLRITGDLTSSLKAGDTIRYSYTIGTTQYQIAYISTITYNSGLNKTIIVPTTLVPIAAGQSGKSLWLIPLFFPISTNKNVCNFQETVAIDMVAGTTFFNQVLTLVLSRRETTKRNFIEKLVAGQKQLAVLLLDSNGVYWLSGASEGSYVTAIDGGTGTAKADANGYTITFTAMEPSQAWEVDPTALPPIGI
jgi:hypothetical protein